MGEWASSPAVAPPSRMSSTGAIRETRNSFESPTNTSSSCTVLPVPAHRQSSTRSMLLSSSTPMPPQSRSGGRITPPVKVEMSVTEQIARQTRKSTVLDPKNALLIMAIPDYDDYKIMQPYSCRSLSNKNKFVGGRDFITRHNPQEVNDFKKQYSRDFGNLNRHRSILAPPTSNLSTTGLFSSSSGSIGLQNSPSRNGSSNNNLLVKDGGLWRKTFTSTMKACWVLTDTGIQALIGPEYRLTTRTPVLPALPSPRPQRPPILPLSCRSPATSLRPETPSSLSAFSARESARKGIGVDLANEKTLAALSRLAASTPKPRTPPCSPLKRASSLLTKSYSESVSTPSTCTDGAELLSLAPYADISWERKDDCDRDQSPAASLELNPTTQQKNVGVSTQSPTEQHLPAVSSMTQHFAMEVSPPMLSLGTLQTGQVYLFPVRVRNVGSRQERFRVNQVTATCAGFQAGIAEASYQRESARLAPGLAAIVTVALSFHHPGRAAGSLRVEAEGLGACDIDIKCTVR